MDQEDKLQTLMLNRPNAITGEVKYPEKGVSNLGDDFLRALAVGTGVEEQAPGDAAGALGALGGMGLSGLKALGAVAIIPPKLAKEQGKALLERIRQNGLQRIIGGKQAMYRVPGINSTPIPNAEVTPEVMKALEFAQQRWPRLFGHLDNITDVDGVTQLRHGGTVSGSSRPSRYRAGKDGNPIAATSVLGISPFHHETADEVGATIGHELTHVADNLTNSDMYEAYDFANKLPGGYFANSQEMRARLQGARTKGYMQGYGRKDIEPLVSSVNSRAIVIPIKPLDSRITSLAPPETVRVPLTPESNLEKMQRLIYERADRKRQGIVDPRVPRKQ